MKEKVFEKMREYGWNLGDNTYKDFADVYDIHYRFIDSVYDYFREQEEIGKSIDLNDISKEGLFETIVFISDFLRAINDIDDTRKVGDSEIDLYNSRNIPYNLSCMCLGDTKEIEYKIRKCNFNGLEICRMLNSLYRSLIYKNWEVVIETDNMITLKGKDNSNIVYLDIRTK